MFQRQAFIGGKWVPEAEIEWRHVDLCDGCGQVIKEPAKPFPFRVAVFNDSMFSRPIGRATHPAKGCVRAAVLGQANNFLDSLEGWPE